MAAVITPTNPIHGRGPHRSMERPGRPDLVLIEGGACRARSSESLSVPRGVFFRRRLVAFVSVCVVLWLAGVSVRSVLAATAQPSLRGQITGLVGDTAGARSASAGASVGHAESSDDAEYMIVQPGDTLWSIARQLRPDGDLRPVVDSLVERAGGTGIEVGQRLRIDGIVP